MAKPTKLHEQRIQQWKRNVPFGARHDGYNKTIKALVGDEIFEAEAMAVSFVPDAHGVMMDENGYYDVVALEVEQTAAVTSEKYLDYVEHWFHLDCESVGFSLVVIDRFGNAHEPNLMQDYYGTLEAE